VVHSAPWAGKKQAIIGAVAAQVKEAGAGVML